MSLQSLGIPVIANCHCLIVALNYLRHDVKAQNVSISLPRPFFGSIQLFNIPCDHHLLHLLFIAV
jgi:hypothetical protein